jgi:hypothetical protein
VLPAGSPTLSVSFTPTDTTNYTAASASVQLTVNKAVPAITWSNPAPITYGTALSAIQLNASANVPGTFAYSPAGGTILTAGLQTLSTTFTPTDAADYASANASVQLQVNRGAPTITWPNPAPITYGTALSAAQLNAAANVPGSFVYSPAAGTILGAGTQRLSATFTPSDTTDYSGATASVLLAVGKATPVLIWPTPTPIPYGTALSSTQLNATANVPGTFVYNPPAGTILKPGSQTLSVMFTPTDSVDYNSVSTSVTLLVTQPLISFSPSSVNFGTVRLNSSPVPITVTVSNPGTGPLSISSIKIAGNNEDNDLFSIINNC